MNNIRNNLLGGIDWTRQHPTHTEMVATENAIIEFAGKGQAQIPFSILKNAGSFVNEGYLAADRFTDSNGVNNTQISSILTYGYYVIIEATSVFGNWNINSCATYQLSSNKWVIYSSSKDYEVNRCNVMKTLFYGTNGSDPRATSSYITGITSIKSIDSRDVGRSGYYLTANYPTNNNIIAYAEATFSSTTGNEGVSFWYNFTSTDYKISGTLHRIAYPLSTTILNYSNSYTVLNWSTFVENYSTVDNPDGIRISHPSSEIYNHLFKCVFLSKSAISFTTTQSPYTTSATNFNGTHGIPSFTLATETIEEYKTKYDSDDYYKSSYLYGEITGTNHGNFSNTDNAFDLDDLTYARYSIFVTDSTKSYYIGRTFSSEYIKTIQLKNLVRFEDAKGTGKVTISLEKYKSSTWSAVSGYTRSISSGPMIAYSAFIDDYIDIDDTIDGLRIKFTLEQDTLISREFELRVYYFNKFVGYDDDNILMVSPFDLEGNETLISIYNNATIPTDTNIKVQLMDETKNISDEHNILANKTISIPITTTPNSSEQLRIKYTFEIDDDSVTPEFYGYGVYKQ